MEILSNNNCTVEIKRGRGGQPGNQNARKHGFYSKTLDEQEKKDYEEARNIHGLEEEIAFIRTKIMSIQRNDPNNIGVFTKAMGTLCRLLETHRHIAKGDKEGLQQTLANVVNTLAVPLGIGVGKFLGK